MFNELTADLVHVLQGQTQGLVRGARWGQDGVQGVQQALAAGVALLALDIPALEPHHVPAWFQHVVAVPAGDGHERHGLGVVADLLNVGANLLLDFIEANLELKQKRSKCINH